MIDYRLIKTVKKDMAVSVVYDIENIQLFRITYTVYLKYGIIVLDMFSVVIYINDPVLNVRVIGGEKYYYIAAE